jgi:hydrogenase expression/formation protein HypE
MLSLDVFHIANEGTFGAVVPAERAERAVAQMRAHPLGARAAVIGRVTDQHRGIVAARTALGGSRTISVPLGEQLPRIC